MYNYLIRRKVFVLFGAKFHIYDHQNQLIGYCKQKAFKLKEDIRIYKDESQTVELLHIQARNIIDFSAYYDIYDSSSNQLIGTWRRKGWSSLFRDKWEIFDCNGNSVGVLEEDSSGMAFIRRFVCNLIPQSYYLSLFGNNQAVYSQCFNPFVFKLKVELNPQCQLHPYLVLAGGVLLSAIEGRQS